PPPPPPSKPQPSSSSTNPLEDYSDVRALFKRGEEGIGKYIDEPNQKPTNLGTLASSNARSESRLTDTQRESVRKLVAYLNKHNTQGELRKVPGIGRQRSKRILSAKREYAHLEIRKLRPILTFETIVQISVMAANEADMNKDSSFTQMWNSLSLVRVMDAAFGMEYLHSKKYRSF
nr:hypothetical protein [Tanacetum cinerariifolium]